METFASQKKNDDFQWKPYEAKENRGFAMKAFQTEGEAWESLGNAQEKHMESLGEAKESVQERSHRNRDCVEQKAVNCSPRNPGHG